MRKQRHRGASRPLYPRLTAGHGHWAQEQGLARPSSFAGSRARSSEASTHSPHRSCARPAACKHAWGTPESGNDERTAVRTHSTTDAPVSQTYSESGGSTYTPRQCWEARKRAEPPSASTALAPHRLRSTSFVRSAEIRPDVDALLASPFLHRVDLRSATGRSAVRRVSGGSKGAAIRG